MCSLCWFPKTNKCYSRETGPHPLGHGLARTVSQWMALSSLAASGVNSKRTLLTKYVKALYTGHGCWERSWNVQSCSSAFFAFFPGLLIFFFYRFPKFVFPILLPLLFLGFFVPIWKSFKNVLIGAFSFDFSACSIWRSYSSSLGFGSFQFFLSLSVKSACQLYTVVPTSSCPLAWIPAVFSGYSWTSFLAVMNLYFFSKHRPNCLICSLHSTFLQQRSF